ncbi:hypothetical protein SAMD00019534_024950, partial [Acytostelium subglobosum LB1]|uniref:hypothetical protein n=1 Tax=Acytostelium subglobosum LB1 TaxID=1410327 RepID=UPI000644C5F0
NNNNNNDNNNEEEEDKSVDYEDPFKQPGINRSRSRHARATSSCLSQLYYKCAFIYFSDVNGALQYVHKNTRQNLKSVFMGLATVFLVVMFLTCLQNLIQNTPIVFLKLAEDQTGEFDLVLTGDPTPLLNQWSHESRSDPMEYLNSFTLAPFFLNSTMITRELANATTVDGVAPRWESIANIRSPATNISSPLIVLAMNSTLEQQLGLGRGWTLPPLIGNQAYFSSTFLRRIQVEPNQQNVVHMRMDFIDTLDRLSAATLIPTLSDIEKMIVNYTGVPIPPSIDISQLITILQFQYPVMGAIESPGGKYPSQLGNVAVLESDFVDKVLRDHINSTYQSMDNTLLFVEQIMNATFPIFFPTYNITNILQPFNIFQTKFKQFAKDFQLNDYSMTPIVMLHNRVDVYSSPNEQDIKRSLMEFTNQVSTCIGYNYPAIFTTPLASALNMFMYPKMSLDQIFNCVAAVLLVLGALMIYSLLLSDVEGKTFEYGMLRAQGMRHHTLIILLLVQSLYFSIPGILLGLIFGWVCYAVVAHFIYQFVILPVNLDLHGQAVLVGVVMGLLLPILANIVPIQRALSKTLRDALDIYHQVKSETMVKFQKLESIGFNPLHTVISIICVACGFAVYYLIPLSFIFSDMSLFFGVLTAILLAMLFGLALLAQSVQSLLERLFLALLVWGPDRRTLYSLIRKNLSSHRGRNAKTSMMFTICLTFIIFTGCVFRLQGHNIQQLVRLGVGSDIAVISTNSEFELPQDDLRAFLNNELVNNSATTAVMSYSFATFSLDNVMNIVSTTLYPLAQYPSAQVKVYGIEPNYLDTAYLDFYRITKTNPRLVFPQYLKRPDIIRSLYVNEHKDVITLDPNNKITPPPDVISNGSQPNISWSSSIPSNNYIYRNYTDMVLSDAFALYVGADTNTPFSLDILFDQAPDGVNNTVKLLAKPQSMVSMFPSFFFSSYSQTVANSPVLISIDQFKETMRLVHNLTVDPTVVLPDQTPKSRLLIRLKPNTSQSAREFIVNGCKNFLKSDSIQVLDTAYLLATTVTAVQLLELFFYTVSGISIVLCFFMLSVSFAANIHENAWEFSVLRSIGLTGFQVKRIYIYEALVLIICSVALGLFIGLGVAITLTLQFDLFTQLPFSFQFPYYWFFGVILSSIIISIFVSSRVSNHYSSKQIASLLKGK